MTGNHCPLVDGPEAVLAKIEDRYNPEKQSRRYAKPLRSLPVEEPDCARPSKSERASAKVNQYDAREAARSASPVALTGGGLAAAGVLAAGGPLIGAIAAGVGVFVLVAVVVESSLRRITSS